MSLSDDTSIAIYSALSNIVEHLDQVEEMRSAVQRHRIISDLSIFERFPPLLVPYNLTDQNLYSSEFFQSLLPTDVPLLRIDSRQELLDLGVPAGTIASWLQHRVLKPTAKRGVYRQTALSRERLAQRLSE